MNISVASIQRNTSLTFFVFLADNAKPGSFRVNPTLATGDFKVSIDGGAFADLATLPVVTPVGSRAVKVELSAAETDGVNIILQMVDQTTKKEWADDAAVLQTT